MTQIERITAMEQALNEITEAAKGLEAARERFEAAHAAYEALDAYYGGEDWKRDLADDEAGRLPADLRRGVLSEDGAWNALNAYRELLGRSEG